MSIDRDQLVEMATRAIDACLEKLEQSGDQAVYWSAQIRLVCARDRSGDPKGVPVEIRCTPEIELAPGGLERADKLLGRAVD